MTDALGSSMSREVDKGQESLKAKGIARGGPHEISVQLVGRVASDIIEKKARPALRESCLNCGIPTTLKPILWK